MTKTLKIKITIDILMTLLLLFLMGYQFWGELAHEWAGAVMFLLFIVHHILNRNWYKNIFKGRYSPMRIIQLLVNTVLLAVMAGMMVSGVILSRHVFAFLPIQGGTSFARILHMACAYWGLVLMALHLGLHWNMVMSTARKAAKRQSVSRIGKIAVFVFATVIAAYGLSVFIRRNLADYMFLRTQFVFLDFGESKLYFYAEYLAMMGLFIYLAHYVMKLFHKVVRKRTPESEHKK